MNIQSLLIFLAYSKHIKNVGDYFELQTTEFWIMSILIAGSLSSLGSHSSQALWCIQLHNVSEFNLAVEPSHTWKLHHKYVRMRDKC
jgi:hypothetical protein